MSDEVPPQIEPEPPRGRHVPESPKLPSWVPTLIGSILVIMAGLAVYTGLRYRNPTLANGIIKRRGTPRVMTGIGAPGEPEPGSSLVYPGASVDANEPVPHQNGAAPHMTARRGMITNVLPDDAMIYVNSLAIGEARQFNTLDEVYDFPAPGSYTVRILAPGYKEQQIVILVADGAELEIARINVKLDRQ